MRAVVHAGMHKTGTSSIQDSLKAASLGKLHYLDWQAANHSAMFALLFHEPVEQYHAFKGNGATREELLRKREIWHDRLLAQMSSSKYESIILSAEDISLAEIGALERLRKVLDDYCSDIQVIAYAREPVAFMQSAFQQRVRGGGLNKLVPAALWPNYRNRFEKIDLVFGRENVKLKKFSAPELVDGDVVADFSNELGISLKKDEYIRSNASYTLEALSLLFAQRYLGDGFVRGFPGAQRSNTRFVAALGEIGSQKFQFAASLVDPVLEANRQDLEWMEERLGSSLRRDDRESTGRLIGSEEDLLSIAEENRAELENLLMRIIQSETSDPHGRLVRNLEMVRKVFY